MDRVKSLKKPFSLSYNSKKDSNSRNKKNGNGNGNGKKPMTARKVLFEPIEPRLLLSADLPYADSTAFDPLIRPYDEPTQNLQLIESTASAAVAELDVTETDFALVLESEAPDDPAIGDTSLLSGIMPDSSLTQLFYLDLDGEQDVTYEGPVTVSDINVNAFTAPDWLQGQESDIVSSLLSSLDQTFSGLSVVFTAEKPASGTDYSTIYLGGDSFETLYKPSRHLRIESLKRSWSTDYAD